MVEQAVGVVVRERNGKGVVHLYVKGIHIVEDAELFIFITARLRLGFVGATFASAFKIHCVHGGLAPPKLVSKANERRWGVVSEGA